MRNFRKMDIWQLGIDLAISAYKLTRSFPKEEYYGLRSQINRAVVSIPSNIAEGCSRASEKDFARFLEISLGSAYEVETDLIIAEKLGYIESKILAELVVLLNSEQRQIHSLINKLRD